MSRSLSHAALIALWKSMPRAIAFDALPTLVRAVKSQAPELIADLATDLMLRRPMEKRDWAFLYSALSDLPMKNHLQQEVAQALERAHREMCDEEETPRRIH